LPLVLEMNLLDILHGPPQASWPSPTLKSQNIKK
jgi:hypothetical protein